MDRSLDLLGLFCLVGHKICFAGAADRANPVIWDVGKISARRNVAIRVAFFWFVDKVAGKAEVPAVRS